MHQHLSACLSSFNLSVSAASTNRAVLAEYIESIFVSVQFSWSNLFYLLLVWRGPVGLKWRTLSSQCQSSTSRCNLQPSSLDLLLRVCFKNFLCHPHPSCCFLLQRGNNMGTYLPSPSEARLAEIAGRRPTACALTLSLTRGLERKDTRKGRTVGINVHPMPASPWRGFMNFPVVT